MTSNFHAPSSHCSASHVASNEGDRRASSAQCRSSSAYGSNPRYFDATFDRHPRARQARDSLNSYAEPIVVPPLNSKVSRVRFQSPAGRSAHHFLDRLGTFESLDHFGDLAGFILQCSAPGVEDDDEYIDISALADQYLDLSEHCPVETDLPSRYSSPSTDSHTSTDVECPQIRSNRRRSADWNLPRLPRPHDGDDKLPAQDSQARPERHTNKLSPFHHILPTDSANTPNTRPYIVYAAGHQLTSQNLYSYQSYEGQSALRFTQARRDGRSKRQALACLFCRSRKIACGRPATASEDQTCNQCARRSIGCVYPTESRRGQHSRVKSLARKAQKAMNSSNP